MPRLLITPDPHMLASMRANQHLTARICLEELFDNSSDAGATSIEVSLKDGNLIVLDNGRGIPDLAAFFQLGKHRSHNSGRAIGRFGVGFKDAALWIGDEVDVDTSNGLLRLRARVNWETLMNEPPGGAPWDAGDYSESPVAEDSPTYTRLIFSHLFRNRMRISTTTLTDIAYDFTPAIRSGLRIVIDGSVLKPSSMPELLERIEIDDCLDGRHFKLLAGIKADNSEPRRFGYDVSYMNKRLTVRRDYHGVFGDYSANRFYGYIELLDDGDEDWSLAKNKDNFAEREELYAYLLPKIEPLLKQAHILSDEIEYRNSAKDASVLMSNAAKRTYREIRAGRGGSNGTAQPANTGRKRTKAERSDPSRPGSVAGRDVHQLIRIEFDCHDPDRVGYVQRGGTTMIIHLNPDFPVDFRNRSVLIAIGTALFTNHIVNDGGDPNTRLHFAGRDASDSFLDEISRLLRNVVMQENQESVNVQK